MSLRALIFFLSSKPQAAQTWKMLPQISANQISPTCSHPHSFIPGHFKPSCQHTTWSLFYLGEVRVLPRKAFPTKVLSTCWYHLRRLTLCTTPSSFSRAPWHGQFSCSFHEKRWQTGETPCQEARALGVAQLLLTGTSLCNERVNFVHEIEKGEETYWELTYALCK